MQPEAKKYLYDIWKSAERLTRFGSGKSIADYRTDDLLRSAVERQFIIIGEALSQLLQHAPELGASISDVKRIIAFRNILVHGYAKISDDDVWRILQHHLPVLSKEIEMLLQAPDQGPEPPAPT